MRSFWFLSSLLALSLGLSACGEEVGECPLETILAETDVPCTCAGETVDSLPGGAECVCTAEGLDCGDLTDDTAGW